MARVRAELRARFGDRAVAPGELQRYSHDSGIFELTPTAAVAPADEEDVRFLLELARRHALPVVARAGGSNTGGAAITDGLLVLLGAGGFSEVHIDPQSRIARCGVGVRHDLLQRRLREHGLWLPSDPSSGPLSYIGGNIATRASGPHALRHGAINRYVREARMLLADGTVVDTRKPDSLPPEIRRSLARLAARIRADPATSEILESRREFKWASGYELLALLDHADDVSRALPRLLTGSLGTLGIVTEVELRALPRPRARAATLLRFARAADACRAAVKLRRDASAVEIVSRSALEILRRRTDTLGGDEASAALLIVEHTGSATRAPQTAREAAAHAAASYELTAPPEIATEESEIDGIWRARKALLPVIRRLSGSTGVPYSLVNDVGVPPERLHELMTRTEEIFTRRGVMAAIYGHAGSGNLHLRPLMPAGDLQTAVAVADEIYALVIELGGTITAEHGMGRLRAPFLEREWGHAVVGYMRELKAIFDPAGTLNPGVMFVSPGYDFGREGWPVPPSL